MVDQFFRVRNFRGIFPDEFFGNCFVFFWFVRLVLFASLSLISVVPGVLASANVNTFGTNRYVIRFVCMVLFIFISCVIHYFSLVIIFCFLN